VEARGAGEHGSTKEPGVGDSGEVERQIPDCHRGSGSACDHHRRKTPKGRLWMGKCVPCQLTGVDEEHGGPDARVHLRDPIPNPLRAEPNAGLNLRAPISIPLRAQFGVRIPGRGAPAPDTCQARLPRHGVDPREGASREGEPPPYGGRGAGWRRREHGKGSTMRISGW
jgi:hypothetical protein